jgi:hypothetical protein
MLMLNRRLFTGLLAAGVVASIASGMARAEDTPVAKNVVLVHGLYADGSSWIDVIPYLQRAGLKVTAVQNPLTSLADDVAATRRALAMQDRTINPELERFLAKRMNATTIELDSSHVSLVSHPKEIADLILLAAGRKKPQ